MTHGEIMRPKMAMNNDLVLKSVQISGSPKWLAWIYVSFIISNLCYESHFRTPQSHRVTQAHHHRRRQRHTHIQLYQVNIASSRTVSAVCPKTARHCIKKTNKINVGLECGIQYMDPKMICAAMIPVFLISTMATHIIFPRDGVTVPLQGFGLGNPMLVMTSDDLLHQCFSKWGMDTYGEGMGRIGQAWRALEWIDC